MVVFELSGSFSIKCFDTKPGQHTQSNSRWVPAAAPTVAHPTDPTDKVLVFVLPHVGAIAEFKTLELGHPPPHMKFRLHEPSDFPIPLRWADRANTFCKIRTIVPLIDQNSDQENTSK